MPRLLILLTIQFSLITYYVNNIQKAFCQNIPGETEKFTDAANRWAFLVDMVECAKPEEKARRLEAIQSWESQMRDLEIPETNIFSYTLAEDLTADVCREKLEIAYGLARHRIPKDHPLERKGKVEIHLYVNAKTKIIRELFQAETPKVTSDDKRADRVLLVLNCVDAPANSLETFETILGKANDGNSVVGRFEDNYFAHCILITQEQDFCLFHRPAGWKPKENLKFFELLREGLAGRCMLKYSAATHVELTTLCEYLLADANARDRLCWYNRNESFPLGKIKKMQVEIPRDLMRRTGDVFTRDEYKAEKESAQWRAGKSAK